MAKGALSKFAYSKKAKAPLTGALVKYASGGQVAGNQSISMPGIQSIALGPLNQVMSPASAPATVTTPTVVSAPQDIPSIASKVGSGLQQSLIGSELNKLIDSSYHDLTAPSAPTPVPAEPVVDARPTQPVDVPPVDVAPTPPDATPPTPAESPAPIDTKAAEVSAPPAPVEAPPAPVEAPPAPVEAPPAPSLPIPDVSPAEIKAIKDSLPTATPVEAPLSIPAEIKAIEANTPAADIPAATPDTPSSGSLGLGGPLAAIAMGADPSKVATNYAEKQGISSGLDALGATEAVPYAGSILQALNGDVGGGIGSAGGALLGNMLLPGVGGIIGGTLGNALLSGDGLSKVGDTVSNAVGNVGDTVSNAVSDVGDTISNVFSGGGGCYITTATHVANGKDDDEAYELKTLRHFRDTFMRDDPVLSGIVDDYEKMSPSIVEGINARKDAKEIYKHIHKKYLVPATRAVTRAQNVEALHIYADMITYLAPMAAKNSSDAQAVKALEHEAKMVVKATA